MVLLGAALLTAGCSCGDGAGKAPVATPQPGNPHWVDPDGNAARQVAANEKAGRKTEAARIRRIAGQPMGEWLSPENPEGEARGFTEAAARSGSISRTGG